MTTIELISGLTMDPSTPKYTRQVRCTKYKFIENGGKKTGHSGKIPRMEDQKENNQSSENTW